MNDPLVNIGIDVNLFNNIHPDLNGNQSSEDCDCLKLNKSSITSNADRLVLSLNIRSIGAIFDTFNCFTKILNKKVNILNFSESWLYTCWIVHVRCGVYGACVFWCLWYTSHVCFGVYDACVS